MAKRKSLTAADFTTAELKAMLAAKTKIDELQEKRAALQKELDRVERELAKLASGKAGRLKKKAGRKKVAKKRVTNKVPVKRAARTSPSERRVTVESVVVDLLKTNGSPMAFKDILATIQKKRLVKTKSKDFANVLRRTLSTSGKIKRAARGVYRA